MPAIKTPANKTPAQAAAPAPREQARPAAPRKAARTRRAVVSSTAASSASASSSPPKARKRSTTKEVTQPLKATAVTKPAKAAKPAKPQKAAKPARVQKSAKPAKATKPPKLRQKPVRDSFTMPEADFALIATLKARTLAEQRETKKSELLRAGLHALAAMDTAALVAALGELEPVKIGRPKAAQAD